MAKDGRINMLYQNTAILKQEVLKLKTMPNLKFVRKQAQVIDKKIEEFEANIQIAFIDFA